jgi:hypothetical protein
VPARICEADLCSILMLFSRNFRDFGDSTRGMFERGRSGALEQVLPDLLVSAFKQSEWYPPLRVLRDELTHADIGTVHEDPKTGFVSYTHTGLGSKHQALIIENIFARMETDIEAVNRFLGTVFFQLNTLLKDNATTQMCGLQPR